MAKGQRNVGGYFDRRNWLMALFKDRKVKATSRHVGLTINEFANQEGQCFPSHSKLREETNLSVSAIKSAINDLVDVGALEIPTMGRFRASVNTYRFMGYLTEWHYAPIEAKDESDVAGRNLPSSREVATSGETSSREVATKWPGGGYLVAGSRLPSSREVATEPLMEPLNEPSMEPRGDSDLLSAKSASSDSDPKVEAKPETKKSAPRRQSENSRAPKVSAEFRQRMIEKHESDPIEVDDEIDRALNHTAVDKAKNVELYVQNWLNRGVKYARERNDGAGSPRGRPQTFHERRIAMEKAQPPNKFVEFREVSSDEPKS